MLQHFLQRVLFVAVLLTMSSASLLCQASRVVTMAPTSYDSSTFYPAKGALDYVHFYTTQKDEWKLAYAVTGAEGSEFSVCFTQTASGSFDSFPASADCITNSTSFSQTWSTVFGERDNPANQRTLFVRCDEPAPRESTCTLTVSWIISREDVTGKVFATAFVVCVCLALAACCACCGYCAYVRRARDRKQAEMKQMQVDVNNANVQATAMPTVAVIVQPEQQPAPTYQAI